MSHTFSHVTYVTAFPFKSLQILYQAKLQQNSRKSTQTGYQHLDIYHKKFSSEQIRQAANIPIKFQVQQV